MLKKLKTLALLVCGLSATTSSTLCQNLDEVFVSTSFHEPATDGLRFITSEDGLRWDTIQGMFLHPEVGKQKVLRDPSIAKGPDGTFHLVWTTSWRGDRGFGYSSSRDLIHWTQQRHIEVMTDTTTVNVWAPELFYDTETKQFIIVWASCIPGKFPDKQEDHKNNHRLYYVTTRDFRTFSKSKLFYDPGFSAIDATIVRRGKADYVLVLKDNSRPERNIKVAFGKSALGPWSAASAPFTPNFTEGPSTAQIGDKWLVYYDSYSTRTYGAHSTSDFVNFEDVSDKVSFPVGHKHGTVFRAPRKTVEGLKGYYRDFVHYTGAEMSNSERHDGGLPPTIGVHCIQTMRGAVPWTYNHQPMLASFAGKLWLHYLTDPRSEHEQPGKTMMQFSEDGYRWSAPQELFPTYDVPDGFSKKSLPNITAQNTKAIMHQRVGWYVWQDPKNSQNQKLIAIGNYGICLTPKDDPNDGNGIGRVVREVKADGTMGEIFFIYYNHDFGPNNTSFPHYTKSKDKQFIAACKAILEDPLQRMQWVEEADRNDVLIPLAKPYKAFSYYTLPDGRIVGLWKHALTSISADGGNTWRTPVFRAPGFVNSNAKIWGQRLSDGMYATVYNPSEYRWPLAISLSTDGLNFSTLSLIDGDVTPLRHGGNYKSYGPQYVRGIQERNPQHPDNNLWLTYSHNKEDIWISRVVVPVRTQATSHANNDFAVAQSLADLTEWNLRSPLLAPISLDAHWLTICDSDPYDYARAERVIPTTRELKVSFDIRIGQTDNGLLDIEFADKHGIVGSRIWIDKDGVRVKGGPRFGTIMKRYEANRTYHIDIELSASRRQATYYVDGNKACSRMLDNPVESFERIVFRTGHLFTEPNWQTPADQDFDMERANETDPTAIFAIANLRTEALDEHAGFAVLKYADFAHYAEHFNAMEDENIITDIPNESASEWMMRNIPLFECPQEEMQEMYYYRWWSLRKHLVRTPTGWAMTEFLVPRKYADKYNLISCALGHHIMEMRWARDTTYLHQLIRTWYYGNNGEPMAKKNNFSSWTPFALMQAFAVKRDTTFALSLVSRLTDEYEHWQNTHRLNSGLYWQADVQDGMEESISGGRKKRYARPTINSYMYGNAKALEFFYTLIGLKTRATQYANDANEIAKLINTHLWSDEDCFFETERADTLSRVREAIGFLPWYFDMATTTQQDAAWLQASDSKGFSAPFGLTTAEQRHPMFRTHGTGTCEWDGAIWPFATSQTLTGMANYLNRETRHTITDSLFFAQMRLYTESQNRRGRPYIGEYLDEKTGAWLMGDRERSRYYNHSTYADLVISGIVGLRPQTDGTIIVNPLIPQEKWDYFCLDGVRIGQENMTIIWDRQGDHYHQGKGLTILLNGRVVIRKEDLSKSIIK